MAAAYLTADVIARRMIDSLSSKSVMLPLVYRGYEEEWGKTHNGYKPGDTIRIEAPKYFIPIQTTDLDLTSKFYELQMQKMDFTVDTCLSVPWTVNPMDLKLNIDKFQEKFIDPAMNALAEKVDVLILQYMAQHACNQVGDVSDMPRTYLDFALAGATLDEEGCPDDGGRSLVMSPMALAYLSDSLKGLFSKSVDKTVSRKYKGDIATFNMFESSHVYTHVCGTRTGAHTMTSSAALEAVSLAITGTASQTITKGDILTVADCYAVHPVTKLNLGRLRQFVVTALNTASGGAYSTVLVNPGTAPFKMRDITAPEFTTRPYVNMVDAAGTGGLPQSGETVTFEGTAAQQYKCHMAFHKNAMAVVNPPMELPSSIAWGSSKSYDGLSLSIARDTSIDNLVEKTRIDMLLGMVMTHPHLACRVVGGVR